MQGMFGGGIISVLLLLLMAFADVAHAAPSCEPTHSLNISSFHGSPDDIPHSNNLRRKTGAAEFAEGIPLYVFGTVRDADCVPIEDAIIEIWQANSFGRYDHPKARASDGPIDPNFAGAGRTKTSNTGEFQFITVYPGVFREVGVPHMHVMVRSDTRKKLNTTFFLGDHPLLESDKAVKNLKERARRQLIIYPQPVNPDNYLEGLMVRMDVVLDMHEPYREY